MNLVTTETTLVLAGAWNGAILTPDWILRHGLGKSREEAQGAVVQVELPAGPFGALESPRFTLEGFTYVARPDALILMPAATDEQSLKLIETCALGVLTTLKHTPIAGIGHNLEYASEDPALHRPESFAQSQNDLLDVAPQDWEAYKTVIASQFNAGAAQVNVQRYADSQKMGIKFNFHHAANNADDALKVLSGDGYNSFWQNFRIASELVTKLFGENQ